MKNIIITFGVLLSFDASAETEKRFYVSKNVTGSALGSNPVVAEALSFSPTLLRLELSTAVHQDLDSTQLVFQNHLALEAREGLTTVRSYFGEWNWAGPDASPWIDSSARDRQLTDLDGNAIDQSSIIFWNDSFQLSKTIKYYGSLFNLLRIKECTETLVLFSEDSTQNYTSARFTRTCANANLYGDLYPAKIETQVEAFDLIEVDPGTYGRMFSQHLL